MNARRQYAAATWTESITMNSAASWISLAARLCMAGILLGDYNILVLDEPGNHLDVETVEALADALLRLRINVFVVEQDCPYPELDDKDRDSFHLIGKNDAGELVAYTRILPPGVSYAEVSVGRVVVDEKARGKGVGDDMLAESLRFVEQQFGNVPIRISAQTYLTSYYQKAGFDVVGDEYLEDGIPHIEMLRPA